MVNKKIKGMKYIQKTLIIIAIFFISIQNFARCEEPFDFSNSIHKPITAQNGMVVSENSYATKAGLEVLKEGGNAVDAAVTMGFVLAVTFPRAGNLGGGGFMLVLDKDSDEIVAIDYREKAPKAATKDMFLDENGNADKEKSRHSIYSAGVPGTVAGLTLALEKYGTISLKKALEPAIKLAEKGFPVSYELKESLIDSKEYMKRSTESFSSYYKEDGEDYEVGEILKQKNLEWSLKQIKKNGPKAFYEGKITAKIVDFMHAENGLITKDDLTSYEPKIRNPIKGTYRGYEIYSMPPPSSGGVHIIEMLNILEEFPLNTYAHNSADYIHLVSEVMKLAYADRSKYLGDPDFVDVPVNELTSKEYAKKLSKKINLKKAPPSNKIEPGKPISEGTNTTHFSVMDKFGNVVSNTYTLNFSYGSKISVPGTGILLNNEMDDFSAKSGVPNAYGLIGGEFNSIEPEKRMLSSMSPTIVLKDGKPFLATGSPGGSRIINTVLQIILNTIEYEMNIGEATHSPRFHHQWLPDTLFIENGISSDTTAILEKKGYKIENEGTIGSAQSIMKIGKYFYGSSDPRRPGGLTEGY
ncbi:MAG: gamma-glutamyltransferase [Thermodesulfobacteriota bacterium]